MISGTCIVMSPELRDLHDKEFSRLNEKIFKDYVSRWRDEYNKPEGIPTKDELIGIIVKVTPNWSDFIDSKDIHTVNIYAGTNENAILSNFAKRPFTYEEGVYDSVEQAFQIHKMLMVDSSDIERFNTAQDTIAKMQSTINGSSLRKLGATRVLNVDELKAWDDAKFGVMKNLIRASLQQNPRVLKALIDTGDSPITHSQAFGEWRIKFPIILEELREELRGVKFDTIDYSKYIDSDGFLTKEGEDIFSTSFNKDKFKKGTTKVSLYTLPQGTAIRIDFTSPTTGNSASALFNGDTHRKIWDLYNSKGSPATNVNDSKYWDSINKIVPKELIELVDSGKYEELETTATITDPETLVIKETALERYFKDNYNVIKQGRNTEYNKRQLDYLLKNYPLKSVLSEDYVDYEVSLEPNQVVDVTNWHKIDSEIPFLKKRQRVNLINRLFSEEVNNILNKETIRLNELLKSTSSSDTYKKLEIAKAIRNLRPYVVIKTEGPFEIYNKVKEQFQVYIDSAESDKEGFIANEYNNLKLNPANSSRPDFILKDEARRNVEYNIKAYKQLVDNFDDFVREAANSYGYTHNVIMNIDANSIKEDTNVESTNEEGHNHIQNLAEDKEESPYKEGWQVNVRELSAFESMSNKVREAISFIERRDRAGRIVPDDLGYAQTLDASYVFAELITALKNMTDASEMMPILENLVTRKPWARQVVNAIKNDDQLFTAFYTVFRKDYLNMWVHKNKVSPDGSSNFKTSIINKPAGTAHYFDTWRDNYEYGIILDEDSIYNKNGDIIKDNASKGLEIVDKIYELFRNKTKAEKQDIILQNSDSIRKALSMLGIQVTPEVLNEVFDYKYNPDNKNNLIGEVVLYNLRTIYKGIQDNSGIKDGEPADLINTYGSAFNNIATTINYVEEDEVESSVRQGKKSLYAHTRPSYMTTLVKKLKGSKSEDYINSEYKTVDFLYDKKNEKWRNSWIENLLNDKEARDKFEHAVVIEADRKEYQEWTPLETFLVLYNQYNAEPIKGGEGYAWYQSPLLSDATSAEFLRGKRYKKNFDKVLADKFYDVVMQEYDRIITVMERANDPTIEKIASFDITDKSEGGAKFHFIPELNSSDYNVVDIAGVEGLNDGLYFIKDLTDEQIKLGNNQRNFFTVMSELKADVDVLKSFVTSAVTSIMDARFNEAVADWSDQGLFNRINEDNLNSPFIYFKNKSMDTVLYNLREYFWNTAYAQSQIIQLLTTDLAYYKDYTEFTKRALEFHSPTDKLNTLAKWDGKYVIATENPDGSVTPRKRRVLYMKDEVKKSASLDDLKEVLNSNKELNAYDKSVIISLWSRVNVTDAQALTTLKSYRQTQIMADLWDDASERAYDNIRNNTWDMNDFMVLWNTRKPYLYTQTNQDDGIGGTLRVPTQHKNSEMIMLTNAIFGSILSRSRKLKAISEFMESNDIDVIQFTTAVKVGGKGVLDLNGDLTEKQVKEILGSRVYNNGKDATNGLNMNVVHEFDFNDYGIQVATPDHGVDSEPLVGTQIRRLIAADQSDDAEFTIGDKTLTKEQWQAYFNAVNVANVRESFDALRKIFDDPKELEKILVSEIRGSSRYNNDLIEAVTLNENGEFNIPLYDSTISNKLQELLNSIIKSTLVKQKINGGSLIMASAWVLNEEDKPKIVWEGEGKNKRIKCIEAYVPCPSEDLYSLLINGKTGEIDIDKKDVKGNYIVPEEYRKAIGYRIPTEDKYSMIPIRIKGFLPRQTGSVIILPEEITTIMGADYDVDKIYMMYKSAKINAKYDIKRAWDDFYTTHPEVVADIEKVKTYKFAEAMEQVYSVNPDLADFIERIEDFDEYKYLKQYEWVEYVRPMFSKWFDSRKSQYVKSRNVEVLTYKDSSIENLSGDDLKVATYNQAKKNNKKQRDNMMIDLMFSVLTNPDTVIKQVNPGGFLEQKRDARIMNLLSVLSLDDVESLGGVGRILSLSLDEAENMLSKYGKKPNPLTPNTWIEYQQRNMSGAGLVPMAATQNASHAITQLVDNFSLKESRRFTFNGDKLGKLNSVKNSNGEYISRNICSYLAAFVDNAKDPVAGDLNINSTTANLAFLLLRIGNSPMTTSLILRQPATMEVVKLVNNSGVTIERAIELLINQYKKIRSNAKFGTPAKDFNFTDTWLAENICAIPNENSRHYAEYDYYNRQIKVLNMLESMFESAKSVGDVVRALRSDTQSGAVGGNIVSGNEKIIRVKELLDKNAQDPNHPLEGIAFITKMDSARTEYDIITSPTPIQTAMYQYGIVYANKWLSKYFPQATSNFMDMVETAKGLTTYGRLDEDTINRLCSHYISYLMTGISNDFSGSVDSRTKYIKEFPSTFGKFKADNEFLVEELPILKRLKAVFKTKYTTSPVIKFNNVGKVTDVQSDGYRGDFRNLSTNESTREFTKQLMIYHFYRGLGFSPSGFANMFPTSFKMDNLTDYVQSLRKVIHTQSDDFTDFLFQYIRNNMGDRRFVPDVSATGLFNETPPAEFDITVTKESSDSMRKFAYPSMKNGVDYRQFVVYNYNNKPYYYVGDGTGHYAQIKPLGDRNYQEYNARENGLAMTTVIEEAKNRGFSNVEDHLPIDSISDSAMTQLEAMSSYFNGSSESISLNDLGGTRKDREAAELDRLEAVFSGSEGNFSEMDKMESIFEKFYQLESMDTDMEGNNKCK